MEVGNMAGLKELRNRIERSIRSTEKGNFGDEGMFAASRGCGGLRTLLAKSAAYRANLYNIARAGRAFCKSGGERQQHSRRCRFCCRGNGESINICWWFCLPTAVCAAVTTR